jgi:hypothetical protein
VSEGTFDMSPFIAQNGIQIGRGATGSVTGSTISGFQCDVPVCSVDGTNSSGILLYQHGAGVTISNNTLSNNDSSLLLVESPDSISVTDNDISARYTGVYIYDATVAMSGNTISDAVYGMFIATWQAATTLTATDNATTSNDIGILVTDWDTGDAFAPAVTFNNGRITSNDTGVDVVDTTGVDATCNYWGDPAGPSGEGSGTGDSVSIGATFSPWLVAPGGACTGSEQVAPVANDDSVLVAYETATAFNVLDNDTDANASDVLTATALTQPTNGTLQALGGGAFLYTPDQGFVGADSFDYTLSDGTDTDTATVTLNVEPLEDLLEGVGSFEVADPGDATQPDGWNIKRAGKSERVCDPLLAGDGACAMMLRGKAAESVRYQAVVDPLRVADLEIGDLLILRGWFKGDNAQKGKIIAKVKAADGTIAKLKLVSQTGTFDYPMSAQVTTLALLKDPTSIKVNLAYPAGSGKLYVDGVVLQVVLSPARTVDSNALRVAPVDASSNVLPLPVAPDGFRGNN